MNLLQLLTREMQSLRQANRTSVSSQMKNGKCRPLDGVPRTSTIEKPVPRHGSSEIHLVEGVERQRPDRLQRYRQRGGVARCHVVGDRAAHRGLQRNAATHAADIDQETRCGLVQMREEIARDRNAPTPSILDPRARYLREEPGQ